MSSPETAISPQIIRKPSAEDAINIALNQSREPFRQVVCVFDEDKGDKSTTTRIPNLHFAHGMNNELAEMAKEMIRADYIIIEDISKIK